MNAAFLGVLSTRKVHSVLAVLSTLLPLTSWRFPPDASTTIQGDNIITMDYVIIGGGTAGSIVASRLTEDGNVTVAVLEAGGDPPLESVLPGLFPLTTETSYDYNYEAVNDYYTSQKVKGNEPGMTAGKLLGGTSSISHTFFLRGSPENFDQWAEAAGDPSWNYEGLLPFFKKSEKVTDNEIENSSTADLHGFDGNLGVLRQKDQVHDKYFESFEEIGLNFNPDINSRNNLGVAYPYHLIADGYRQDGAQSYLGPAKDRENLSVFKKTIVTKILFDDNNNAIGVEAENSKGTVKFYATKEVILAAGAVKSPQLLMLSGIGPAAHLRKLKIPVRSDLPVGKNFRDRVGILLAYKMEASNKPLPPMDPHKFPVPVTVGYKSLNSSQSYPDYQLLNFVFSNDNPGFLQICSNIIKYDNSICNKFYKNNEGHELFTVAVSNSHPVSTGEILLKSKNPMDTPSVKVGLFNNPKDLDDFAEYLLDFSRIAQTSYFQNISAEFVDLGFCKIHPIFSLEYWKCYALEMSSTFWQYVGSCAMGPVVDGKLKVRGVQNLRVVDASAVPSLNSGEILAAVVAFAEKAASLIKDDS